MDQLFHTDGHGGGGPERAPLDHPSPDQPAPAPASLGTGQPGPGGPDAGGHGARQHGDALHGGGEPGGHAILDPLDAAPSGADDPGPRRRRADEPGPEQARGWRFDRPAGRGARDEEAARVAGPASPGTAVVPASHEWDERPAEPPGWNLLGFLWRRKLRIALVATAAMACLTAAIFLFPQSYRASSAVIFQGDLAGAARDDGQREPAFAADTLSNEIELLNSEELLDKVALTLDLTSYPEFAASSRIMPERFSGAFDRAKAWASRLAGNLGLGKLSAPLSASSSGRLPEERLPDERLMETVDALRSHLSVVPVGLSRVIRITAQAHDPELAATVANAVAAAYGDTRAEAKASVTRDAHDWIEKRLNTLHERTLRSARAYDAFRHDSGAVRGKDGTISQEQVSQTSSELTQARALRATLQLTLAQVSGRGEADLDALASASGSSLLPRLREQLAVAAARHAELAASGGLAMPSVAANRAQIADITRSIARERSRIRATLLGQLAVAQSNEQRLAVTLEALVAKVEAADATGAQMQALQRDAAADAEVYRSFVARAEQTDPELAYQPPSVRILSRAVAPLRPTSPNKRMLLPAALLLSLGIGTAAAFVKERARRGVLTLRDLPRPDGNAPLGLLPFVRRRNRGMMRVWDEAVAQVLARMLLPYRGVPPASILVTSALPREGKTRVAIALAAAARNRGLHVLLVDADLRCRTLSNVAGMARTERNLVRLLEGEMDAADAPTYHGGWGFAVLPAGKVAGSPVDLLATHAWENTLRDLEELFDLIVIDTPPVLAAGDTWMMARHADATVVVAEWAATQAATIELAVEQLSSAHARVLGLVLTKVSPREHASHGFDESVMFSPKLLRYCRSRRLV